MLSTVTRAKLDDMTESVPVFSVIALMSFTYNLGIGMTAGFVLYPLMKLLAGRAREVPPGLWVLGALSLCFFIFYPY
jgi:AGZA family xanthine/uracil permease-like MFS transporter